MGKKGREKEKDRGRKKMERNGGRKEEEGRKEEIKSE